MRMTLLFHPASEAAKAATQQAPLREEDSPKSRSLLLGKETFKLSSCFSVSGVVSTTVADKTGPFIGLSFVFV